MASQSTEEIPLSDSESESESEPENKGKKLKELNDEPSGSQENRLSDNETKENEEEEEGKQEEKSGEGGEAEASVYTEQDLTEEGRKIPCNK